MADRPVLDGEYAARLRDVAPLLTPGAFYFTGEDNLRVLSLNASSVTELTIVGRFLAPDGQIQAFRFRHVMFTDRTVATTTHALGLGWLLDVSVVAASGTPLLGQVFVRLQVVRGLGGATQVLATLAQGVCNAVQHLSYPGSAIRTTLEAPGAIRSIAGTDPAAGVEISETVPTAARWRLLSLSFTCATAIAIADRVVRLVFDDGASIYFQSTGLAVQAASSTFRYTWSSNISYGNSVGANLTGAYGINLFMLAGHRVTTSTELLQAADDFSAPQLAVEEWLEGA